MVYASVKQFSSLHAWLWFCNKYTLINPFLLKYVKSATTIKINEFLKITINLRKKIYFQNKHAYMQSNKFWMFCKCAKVSCLKYSHAYLKDIVSVYNNEYRIASYIDPHFGNYYLVMITLFHKINVQYRFSCFCDLETNKRQNTDHHHYY